MILSSDNDKTSVITTAVCIACALASGGSYIYNNLQSQQKITARSEALQIISQHVTSDTCWSNGNSNPKYPFKLNDRITLKGTTYGDSPTGCFVNPSTGQYAQAKYSNGELIVTQVFSAKEVKSQIGARKND